MTVTKIMPSKIWADIEIVIEMTRELAAKNFKTLEEKTYNGGGVGGI